MDDHKALLKEVFGESSDSEDYEQQQPEFEQEDAINDKHEESDQNPSWEQIKEIKGLWLCRHFLSPQQQSSLISAILNEGWFTEASHNQAMRFGDLPSWATEISNSIYDEAKKEACPFPSDLLLREPLFDQLIVNAYQPGEGISAHVDLMRFEDGIAIVSLESSCVMHFTEVERTDCDVANDRKMDLPMTKIPVYPTPGSLVLMSEEARYCWKHEINRKPGFQIWEGQELNQKRRISVTLRKLCKVE